MKKELKNPSCFFGCKNVSVFYNNHRVVDNVSFAMRAGEILSIIGPNGGGKTTLTRALVGLIAPQRGAVIRRKGLRIGYIPQHVALNIQVPMNVINFLKLSPLYEHTLLAPLVKQLSLEDLLAIPLHDLSGGQMQRVLFARAVLGKPHLLILDEPDRSLDIDARIYFYELLRLYAAENGCALILVSHDLHLVMASTDRVLCLNHHVCCTGTPKEISMDPAYKRIFGAAIAKHFALYSHEHNHHHR